MENNVEFPQEIENRATVWPSNLISGYMYTIIEIRISKRYLYNSPAMKTTWTSIQFNGLRWYLDRVLFDLKKQGNSATYNNMGEPGGHCTK